VIIGVGVGGTTSEGEISVVMADGEGSEFPLSGHASCETVTVVISVAGCTGAGRAKTKTGAIDSNRSVTTKTAVNSLFETVESLLYLEVIERKRKGFFTFSILRRDMCKVNEF